MLLTVVSNKGPGAQVYISYIRAGIYLFREFSIQVAMWYFSSYVCSYNVVYAEPIGTTIEWI